MVLGFNMPNWCLGPGPIFSIQSLLIIALLVGAVILVFLTAYEQWQKISKK